MKEVKIFKLTLEDAKKMVEAAQKMAEEMGKVCSFAVCDEGGFLIYFHRMDGGKPGIINAIIRKAWTAAVFRSATSTYLKRIQPGMPGYQLRNISPGQTLFVQGGVPIRVDKRGKVIVEEDYEEKSIFNYEEFEEVIGSFACGGASGPDDERIAKHAIQALNDLK